MSERAIAELLEQHLREARRWTRAMTDRTPDEWIYRSVPWTENTIGWQMGHLAQQLDLSIQWYFGAERTLDAEWDRLFGFGCEVYEPSAYPPVNRLRRVFDSELQRFLEQLGQVEEDAELLRRLTDVPDWITRRNWTVLNGVVNVIYHEGEHAGAIGTLLAHFEGI